MLMSNLDLKNYDLQIKILKEKEKSRIRKTFNQLVVFRYKS